MTTRYQKRHYEDVACILADAVGIAADCDRADCGCKVESTAIVRDFADLFAVDNPLFNRDRFLSACGLDYEGKE